MAQSMLLHRLQLIYLGARIVASYTWYNFRRNRLKIRFKDDDQRLSRIHRTNARLYARFAAGARGGLIKLGQLASARADVMPTEFIEELAGLQDQVQAAPYQEVAETIKAELGRPVDELFAQFNQIPLGAASLGQVHEAELPDGRRVAVKIQYRHIERILARDFDMLHAILPWLQPLQPRLYFLPLFTEFRRAVEEEVDYRREAENAKRVRRELGQTPNVRTPEIVDELSSERVLTMTFVEGYKITDTVRMQALELSPAEVMKRVVEIYSEQIFVHGFFQSDPHPGNLFFDKAPDGAIVVGLIDFGQAKEVPVKVHQTVLRGAACLLAGDVDGCARAMIDLEFMSEKDLPRLTEEVRKLAARLGPNLLMGLLSGGSEGQPNTDPRVMKAEFEQFLRETDGIKVPPDVVLYGRTFTLLIGLCARIAPDLKLFPTLLPYLTRALLTSPHR